MKRYTVKNIAETAITAEAEFLSDARLWVSQQKAPSDYVIWEFVGANPALQSHYIRIAN